MREKSLILTLFESFKSLKSCIRPCTEEGGEGLVLWKMKKYSWKDKFLHPYQYFLPKYSLIFSNSAKKIYKNVETTGCNYFYIHLNCFMLISDTGFPTKHDNSKTTWKSSLVFEFICDIYSSIYFNMYDSWNNYHIILLALAFPKSGLRFLCFQ